jgi:hypothetical protein
MTMMVKDRPTVLKELHAPIRSGHRLMKWRRTIGITRPVFAVLSSCSERSVATQEAKSRLSLPKERNLNEAHRLLLGLCEIMDSESVSDWLNEANEWFDNQTPMAVIKQGKIDKVWELVYHTKTAGYL